MHFDYFGPSMISVGVIFTGQWVTGMRAAMDVSPISAIAFYTTAMFIGRYLLMNLLIAVVITTLAESGGPPTTKQNALATVAMVASEAKAAKSRTWKPSSPPRLASISESRTISISPPPSPPDHPHHKNEHDQTEHIVNLVHKHHVCAILGNTL